MKRAERFEYILSYFQEHQPNVTTELNFGSDFQLLVAVMLSAQCTDARINLVTPELWRHYPTAEAMSKASEEDIFELIKSVSYPNAKASHLLEMSRLLVERHGGVVPSEREALEALPGVGRKTASVIRAVWFGLAEIAVDTHVFRVSHRLQLVPSDADTPFKVEQALHRYIPDNQCADAHHWLLLHGRHICQSRKPKCEICPFSSPNAKVSICPSSVL